MKIIGHNQIEDDAATRQSWEKLKSLNELINQFCFATNTDVVNDLKSFEKDPLKYAIDTIKAKNPEAKILGLSDKGYCNLYGYNLDHLTDLFSRYVNTPGDIEYNPKTRLFDVTKDRTQYDIVAVTPLELEKLDLCNQLAEVIGKLNAFENTGIGINAMTLYKWVIGSADGSHLIPQSQFIKSA
jgi:hypothetical protein